MTLAQVLLSGRDRFPEAVALHHAGHHLSYARTFRDVENIAAHLAHLGLGPGQLVANDIRQPISHWLILLALMRLGAVSVSLTDASDAEIAALPDLAALIVGAKDGRSRPTGVRCIPVDPAWLRDPPDHATLPPPAEAAETLGRICFTSGTSGRPKAILLDAGLLRARLAGTARRTRIHTRSVLWCGLGPDTAYGLTATLAAWLEGAAVIFSSGGQGAWKYLTDRHVNLIVASPAALATLVRDAASTTSLPRMAGPIIVAGGRLSLALRDVLLEKLCSEVLIAFGSSEAGGVSLGDARALDVHPGSVGAIFPDVEARIVGEAGTLLPAGASGRLRVRTDSLPSGYLNDPAATAAHFENGWFQSGDLAQISPDGTLTMLGRPTDTLNLGGVKLPAEDLDAIARETDGVTDACAVVLASAEAWHELALLVTGEPNGENLAARIRAKLPMTPRFRLVAIPAIPRGSMGKVNRDALAERIGALLASPPEARAGVRLLGTF